MNSKKITALLLFLCCTVFGQQKITIDEIYNGTFRAEEMDELQSMKNTNQYTVLNFRVNGNSVNGTDTIVGVGYNSGTATNPCIVLLTLKLSANDYVDLYNRNISTSFYSGHCHWGGYLIG